MNFLLDYTGRLTEAQEMEKATKAVRRSATRLISPNESATELSLAVQVGWK